MKPFRAILRRFFAETRPDDLALGRVRRRIQQEHTDREVCRAVLGQLVTPAPGAAHRVRLRLAASRAAPATRRGLRWAPVTVGLLAAAAGGLAVVAVIHHGQRTAPLELAMTSPEVTVELEPSPEVQLAFLGAGQLEGTRQAPIIQWESGTVQVDVEPEQGIELTVSTNEAQVQVVGTAFAVTRDALGTRVEVDRGQVRVSCRDAGEHLLSANQRVTCLPVSAAGLLARVRALQDRGAPAEQLLATVDQALLQRSDSAVLRGELLMVRIQVLASLDREAEALAQAEAYLASDIPQRRDDVLRVAARLAWAQGGCDVARPHLEQLAEQAPAPATLVQLADCQVGSDAEQARSTLGRALDLEPEPRWRAAIEQRLERLR